VGDSRGSLAPADCSREPVPSKTMARRRHPAPYPMTTITENDFIARVERLLREFADTPVEEDLRLRLHDTLLEGYGRALALEAECRQLRSRQMELAGLPNPDDRALSELISLAQQEARLARDEHDLRALIGRLRDREQRLSGPRS
jgi:hypothetical protein